jgi:hypothetical protein
MGIHDNQLTKTNLGLKGKTPKPKQNIAAKRVLKVSKLDLNGKTPDRYIDNIAQ